MAADPMAWYKALMTKAGEYHNQAKWQEKLNALQQALTICTNEPEFPPDAKYRYEVRFELTTVYRRFGQFDRLEAEYQSLLEEIPKADAVLRASVYGELGFLSRHFGRFEEAQEQFRNQTAIARLAKSSVAADAEICRGIGNEGIAIYNLWQIAQPQNPDDLLQAIAKMHERVSLARRLQDRVKSEDPSSKYLGMSRTWEQVGLGRLAVLYVDAGNSKDAVTAAEEARNRLSTEDATVRALAAFFHGYALWHNEQRDQAFEVWQAQPGTTSAAIALAKDPSVEHNTYLNLLADGGVDFDTSDEDDHTAIEYILLGDSNHAKNALPIIERALRNTLMRHRRLAQPTASLQELENLVTEDIDSRKRQAELRRQYRTILQEGIRPAMRAKGPNTFKSLRAVYHRFVTEETQGRTMLTSFKYVNYLDFMGHGRLPHSASGLVKAHSGTEDELFVIFFSYRWIGDKFPDDVDNTQWKRMVSAAEVFLTKNQHVSRENLGIWVDLACIDQVDLQEKRRGIDALPLAVTQCNAMVSLVDCDYYTRAWCVVEVRLIREVQEAYQLHQWHYESGGTLQAAGASGLPDVSNLRLTHEVEDRPKVDFLLKQSVLLGKDDAR